MIRDFLKARLKNFPVYFSMQVIFIGSAATKFRLKVTDQIIGIRRKVRELLIFAWRQRRTLFVNTWKEDVVRGKRIENGRLLENLFQTMHHKAKTSVAALYFACLLACLLACLHVITNKSWDQSKLFSETGCWFDSLHLDTF